MSVKQTLVDDHIDKTCCMYSLLSVYVVVQFCLVSRLSSPGSSPGLVLCCWGRHFALAVPLSTQKYRWILAKLMLGVTLQWTGIPSGGE